LAFIDHPYERSSLTIRNLTDDKLHNSRVVVSDFKGYVGLSLDTHQLTRTQIEEFQRDLIFGDMTNSVTATIPEIRPHSRAVLTLKAQDAMGADFEISIEDSDGRALKGKKMDWSAYKAAREKRTDALRAAGLVVLILFVTGAYLMLWRRVSKLERASRESPGMPTNESNTTSG
jgi:hypothetical protein